MQKPENETINTNRVEDKYIVPKSELVEVKHAVETFLPPHYPEPDTQYCLNQSIYFDSPDLTFLKQHLAKLNSRRKIRIRCYAPNGVHNHIYFIEIKSKQDGQSFKTRLQLSDSGFDHVMSAYQISVDEDLYTVNESIPRDEIEKNAKLINYLLLINKCKPVVSVTYKRYAHQEHEDLRVTIDTEVKCKPLQMIKMDQIKDLQHVDLYDNLMGYGNKFSNAEDFILEVKHKENGDLPQWVSEMLDILDAEAEGFSKYVWAMAKVIQSTLDLIKR